MTETVETPVSDSTTALENLQKEIKLLKEILLCCEAEFDFPVHSRDWKSIRDAVRDYRNVYK